MITAYVTLGNPDDKLSQSEWAHFVANVRLVLREEADQIHGEWFSASDSSWQNVCWCVEVPRYRVERARQRLAELTPEFRQDSIVWAAVSKVEFLGDGQ